MARVTMIALLSFSSVACVSMRARTYPVPTGRSQPVLQVQVTNTLPAVSPASVEVVSRAELSEREGDRILLGKITIHDVVQRCIEGHGCQSWPERNVVPDAISKAAPIGGNLLVMGSVRESKQRVSPKRRCSTSPFRFRDSSVLGRKNGKVTRTYYESCSYYEGQERRRTLDIEIYRRVNERERRALERSVTLQSYFNARNEDEKVTLIRKNPSLSRAVVGRDDGVPLWMGNGPMLEIVASRGSNRELRALLDAGQFRLRGTDREAGESALRSVVSGFGYVSGSSPVLPDESAREGRRRLGNLELLLEAGVSPARLDCQADRPGAVAPIKGLISWSRSIPRLSHRAVELLIEHGYRYNLPKIPSGASVAMGKLLEANRGPAPRCAGLELALGPATRDF